MTDLEIVPINSIVERVNKFKALVESDLMKQGIHWEYEHILFKRKEVPEKGKKILLKSGTELLFMALSIYPRYKNIITYDTLGHCHVTTECELLTHGTHQVVSTCWGSATSRESKNLHATGAMVNTGNTVPQEFWKSKDQSLLGGTGYFAQKIGKQFFIFYLDTESADPSDIENTVLKIAQKRSAAGAMLGAGFSQWFTQDLEDMVPHDKPTDTKPDSKEPTKSPNKEPKNDPEKDKMHIINSYVNEASGDNRMSELFVLKKMLSFDQISFYNLLINLTDRDNRQRLIETAKFMKLKSNTVIDDAKFIANLKHWETKIITEYMARIDGIRMKNEKFDHFVGPIIATCSPESIGLIYRSIPKNGDDHLLMSALKLIDPEKFETSLADWENREKPEEKKPEKSTKKDEINYHLKVVDKISDDEILQIAYGYILAGVNLEQAAIRAEQFYNIGQKCFWDPNIMEPHIDGIVSGALKNARDEYVQRGAK